MSPRKKSAKGGRMPARQAETHSGNIVGEFIQEAMNPMRYTGKHVLFDSRRDALNTILAFCGYSLGEDGKLRLRAQPAHTLTEAEEYIPMC